MKKVWYTVFEGDLITLKGGGVSKYDDAVFKEATKTGDWLQRLQLMTSNSAKCKSAEFPVNHYALVDGSNLIDVGKDVDVLIISWRPKAIEMGEEIITVFDPTTPEFARIQAKSDEKDSGCMFGIEFLVWVPVQKVFATFFLGSKSSRREAAAVKALCRNAATLKSHLIETKKFSWQSPCVTACSNKLEMPDMDKLEKENEKFINPPVSETQTADAAEAKATSRER